MADKFLNTLVNLYAQLGTAKDKKMNSSFASVNITESEIKNLYEFSWEGRKIIDLPIDEALNPWRYWVNDDQELLSVLEKRESELGVQASFIQAQKVADVFGGAALLMVVENSGFFDQPLLPESVKEGSLVRLQVFPKSKLQPSTSVITDISSSRFNSPEFFTLQGSTPLKIHNSRLIYFEGDSILDPTQSVDYVFGSSRFNTLYSILLSSHSFSEVAASLIYEAKLDVITIPELQEKMEANGGTEKLAERFNLADSMKSINNTYILDEREGHQTKQLNFSGLPDMIRMFYLLVCSAANIPATKFLGQSAVGLSATGEGDLKNYYDYLYRLRDTKIRKRLIEFDSVFLKSVFGNRDLAELDFEFLPFSKPGASELALIELNRANRDNIYFRMGVVTPAIVAQQLQTENTYNGLSPEYVSALSDDYEEDSELPASEKNQQSEIEKSSEGADESR